MILDESLSIFELACLRNDFNVIDYLLKNDNTYKF